MIWFVEEGVQDAPGSANKERVESNAYDDRCVTTIEISSLAMTRAPLAPWQSMP